MADSTNELFALVGKKGQKIEDPRFLVQLSNPLPVTVRNTW